MIRTYIDVIQSEVIIHCDIWLVSLGPRETSHHINIIINNLNNAKQYVVDISRIKEKCLGILLHFILYLSL